jgi:hypothetical protein
MRNPPFGNGSGKHKVSVITLAPDWVLLFPEEREPYPDDLPLGLTDVLVQWFRNQKDIRHPPGKAVFAASWRVMTSTRRRPLSTSTWRTRAPRSTHSADQDPLAQTGRLPRRAAWSRLALPAPVARVGYPGTRRHPGGSTSPRSR